MDEKSSYEKINYSLRPAKNIERKMLCEAFKELSYFEKINKYQYIGFGSTYFSDFYLLHRLLGINKLISIEKDIKNKERFEFNKPFSCIEMKFGKSTTVLPKLELDTLSIIWVDYDSSLDNSMLDDLNTIVFNIKPGSVFLITVDVKPDYDKDILLQSRPDELKVLRLSELKKRVNQFKIPVDAENKNLDHIENPKIIYQIIDNQIIESLTKRNGGFLKNKNIYKQLFHFLYNDGTPMLTVGGIIYSDKQSKKINEINFENLDFIRTNDDPFIIEIPKLTFKEINSLDSLLPTMINLKSGKIIGKSSEKKSIPKLKPEDIKKYSKVYRYFPNFAEASF